MNIGWKVLTILVLTLLIAGLLNAALGVPFMRTWAFLALLATTFVVATYLKDQVGSTAAGTLVSSFVILLLVWYMWPQISGIFGQMWPFTREAVSERAIDSDIRNADALRPYGTGMRLVAAEHRKLEEEKITRWYDRALAHCRTLEGMDKKQACQEQATNDKYSNLLELQKVRVPDHQEENSSTWYQSLTGNLSIPGGPVAQVIAVGVFVSLLIIATAIPTEDKKDKPKKEQTARVRERTEVRQETRETQPATTPGRA